MIWSEPIDSGIPVMMQQEDELNWMDPWSNGPAKVPQLLLSYPSGMIEAYYEPLMINSTKNDIPETFLAVRQIARNHFSAALTHA